MSERGNPPSGGGGVHDPDWIDQILDRAADQVAPGAAPAGSARATTPVDTTMPLPVVPEAPAVATVPEDSLGEIRWVDAAPVTPASTPVASQPAGLTAQDVGRSAWADELSSVGDDDPQGWDKLSWQDLEGRRTDSDDPIDSGTTAFGRVMREWGPVLLVAVTIAIVVRLFLVQAYHIPSLSMAPTLEEGDRVIVNRLSYRFGDIERGQVVVFSKPPNQNAGANDLIKRVVALPGETVQFNGGNVFVDGLLVEEPYIAEQGSTRSRSFSIPGCAQADASPELCTVPEDYIFVMGDNRRGSQDSRTFGPIPTDSVVGRAFVRVWPLNNIDWL